MAITFTTAEQAQIEAARALCPEGNDEATTTGNWVPFYQKRNKWGQTPFIQQARSPQPQPGCPK